MKNASNRLIARAGSLALAVRIINVLLARPADAESQVARDSVADQELRAVGTSKYLLVLATSQAPQ
jgi:hypothetical protein